MEYLSRRAVMYPHLNASGRLFGGQALAWIDEEAGIYAGCKMGGSGRFVTKKMSEVEFTHPGNLGDIINVGAAVVRVGRTSLTVACELVNKTTGKTIVKVDEVVFVNLDEQGNPAPHELWLSSNPE